MRNFIFTAAALTVGLLGSTASASIVNGMVTGGGSASNDGVFVNLDPNATFSVGHDNHDTYNLYGFNEDQNITIGSTISVNIGSAPVAGDIVASHYVFYDPAGTSVTSQIGWIEFDAEIYGVATSKANLDASDFLANNNVTYESPTLRGLEGGDNVWIDPTNAMKLWVDWAASTPGDYIRVFTMESPMAAVPLPATGILLLGALGGLFGLRRRKT